MSGRVGILGFHDLRESKQHLLRIGEVIGKELLVEQGAHPCNQFHVVDGLFQVRIGVGAALDTHQMVLVGLPPREQQYGNQSGLWIGPQLPA